MLSLLNDTCKQAKRHNVFPAAKLAMSRGLLPARRESPSQSLTQHHTV